MADTYYIYDANGNMTSDLNKRILNIDYNALNLHQQIKVKAFGKDSGVNNTINYTYATDGVKLRAEYNTTMSISTPINISIFLDGRLQISGILMNFVYKLYIQ